MEFDSSFRTPPSPQLFGQNCTIFDRFSQVKRRTRSTVAERKLRNLMTAFKLEWTGRLNPWTLEYRLPALQSADKFISHGKCATLYFCHVQPEESKRVKDRLVQVYCSCRIPIGISNRTNAVTSVNEDQFTALAMHTLASLELMAISGISDR